MDTIKKLIIIFYFLHSYALPQNLNYLPSSTTNQIIKHTYYTLSYSEDHEQAEWVAYELTKNRVSGHIERTNNFRKDQMVLTGSSALNDYYGSGYDRGHLAPAADMKFSKTAMSESFFMSNISPQNPEFNRGVWRKLEEQVRKWAVENEHLYIITGGVLSSCSSHIGENKIGIPEYYYKIILDYKEPEIKAIALLLENKKGDGKLSNYIKSIDYIENLTGIDFFPNMPNSIERALESQSSKFQWSWK